MLAVTSFMTIDLAPVPLLWALPLSLYLLSFVVAFSATERAQKLHRAMVFVLPGRGDRAVDPAAGAEPASRCGW